MSDSEEEENYCFFGKPLEPYDEDAFPKRRPITVEEQIATDEQGRRRFHGAFTGGFSAGFFNTVGSLEGWTPSEFKSSRQEKAKNVTQRPQDFMDDEDIGEFGFAPEVVRATKDYSTNQKRKRQVFTDGPIPGEPVLQSLISTGDETIGYLLLKNIGLEDRKALKKQIDSGQKTYGCEMPSTFEVSTINSVLEDDDYKIPAIYRQYIEKPKTDTFGMGYTGLDRSHINLFKSSNFVMQDKNKKLSIAGQAFGVGAFEEEDEDIYAKEDMSRYDFELTKEKSKNSKASASNKGENLVFGMFYLSKNPLKNDKKYPPPTIPHSFTGKHKVKKSRFQPLPGEENAEEREAVSRKDMNPSIRARYLGEEVNESPTPSKSIGSISRDDSHRKNNDRNDVKNEPVDKKEKKPGFLESLMSDRFVSASEPDDHTNLLEPVKRTSTSHGTQEMRDAARMKMFGPLTRITLDWTPHAVLCKRFNVPEPNTDGSNSSRNRQRKRQLIFEYQKNNEEDTKPLEPGLTIQKETQEPGPSTSSSREGDLMEVSTTVPVIDLVDSQNTPEVVPPVVPLIKPKQEPPEDIEMTGADTVQEADQPKGLTDRLNIEQNIDLFKAVFLSSSEESDNNEESQEEVKPTPQVTEEMKQNILSDQVLPKIKPIKEGILSNIKFIQPKSNNKPKEHKDEGEKGDTSAPDPNEKLKESLYGPQLPKKVDVPKSNISLITSSSESDDEWVEKSKANKKKKKHHKKKHKKEKHKKHKKHRH